VVTRTPPESDDTVSYPFPQVPTARPGGPSGAGLQFSQTMTGLVTMGCTDPAEGYQNPGAVAISLHAGVTIADLPEFLADPEHRGHWDADGAIPVWGGPIRSTGCGDFRLFQRAIDAPGDPVRETVYTQAITVGEHSYLLRARSVIRPGPPWRLWRAVTTLDVRFLEPGTSQRVVAAGILQLTPVGVLRQLRTVRITGYHPLPDKRRQLRLFAAFVAGALARTYILGRRW
jgi:hypothetical protein